MAADQIFPIVFKPGILRDRPPFQGEYCTDGQWIRFYGGMPKKMGGMLGIKSAVNRYVTNSIYKFNTRENEYIVLYGYNDIFDPDHPNDQSSVYKYVISNNAIVGQRVNYNNLTSPGKLLWQFIPVIKSTNAITEQQKIVCFGSNNLDNILDDTAPYIRYIPLNNANPAVGPAKDFTSPPEDTNGGMVFINPYLFAYGNNGLVRWSKLNDPFDFSGEKTSINISTDKVIFGAKVRGGNSPTLLFWTLSSVIKLSNSPTGEGDELKMTKDVITADSSILSSRCVVEYDGVFYWPGTGRFFIYNGIVNPLENNINRNYFFDTIDMNKRQLVFGVKNVAKDEIWWFYPEKGQEAEVGCTHAIIYNVIENSWYDTSITRDCGFWDNVTGNMYTFGRSLTNPLNTNKYLFKHEVETNEVILAPPVIQRILGGTPSSNNGTSNDNAGGGYPQNAFTQPPSVRSVYTQHANTNLMYDYGIGNLQTIAQIQITNANVDLKQNYRCIIQSSVDLVNWSELVNQTQNFNPRGTLVFDIINPQPARAYRLLADPNIYVNFIMAFGLNGIVDQPQINTVIPSSFTTPTISFASFNPLKQLTGIDRWMEVKKIEPDFRMDKPEDTMSIVINTKEYAQSPTISSGQIVFSGATPKIDYYYQGRQLTFTFASTNYFEMGHVMITVNLGDGQ